MHFVFVLFNHGLIITIMFKGSTRKDRKVFSFQEELDLKLRHLKEDTTSAHKIPNKKQIATVLQQTVKELQLEDESSIENIHPTHSRNNIPQKYQIKQIGEHRIQEQVGLDQKFKITLKEDINYEIQRSQNKKNNNHIWNLVSGDQLITFLMLNFQNYREEDQIMLTDFVSAAAQYYLGLKLEKSEIVGLEEQIRGEITTTDPQILSLNALEILNKKVKIKHYVIQAYIQIRLKEKMNELQRKNKKLMNQVANKIDTLVLRQQQFQNKNDDLARREANLNSKQKNLQLRQKQLLQKQKQLKKTIQEKCYKLSQTYIALITDKTKQAQKKLNLLEKNIKTKLELIQRKSQHLKHLITEANEFKVKKNQSEGEARLRVKKLQRQLQSVEKKYRGQIQQLEGEEKQMLRSITALQDKLTKAQKKVRKQKERVDQLQQFQRSAKHKLSQLQEQNKQLKSKLQDMVAKIPEQNILKTVKQKEKTSRSNKSKHKKCKNQINSIILVYELLLSVAQLNTHQIDTAFAYKLIELSKCMLPQILSFLCNEQDNTVSTPHHLVLFIANSVFTSTIKIRNKKTELSDREIDNRIVENRIWSNELASLIQMPFNKITKRSILLFMLPFTEWTNPTASHFFTSTLRECCSQIQSILQFPKQSVSNLQLELFTSQGLINFMISQYLCQSINQLNCSEQNSQRVQSYLRISNCVMDLLLLISKEYKQNIAHSYVLKKLIIVFQFLVSSLISPYSLQSGKFDRGDKASKIGFQYYEMLEQLSQKLSILIQRIVYQSTILNPNSPEIALIKKVHGLLQQMNKLNGQSNSLILANLNSILQVCSST